MSGEDIIAVIVGLVKVDHTPAARVYHIGRRDIRGNLIVVQMYVEGFLASPVCRHPVGRLA